MSPSPEKPSSRKPIFAYYFGVAMVIWVVLLLIFAVASSSKIPHNWPGLHSL